MREANKMLRQCHISLSQEYNRYIPGVPVNNSYFFLKKQLYLGRMVTNALFKVCAIASYTFCPSVLQIVDALPEKSFTFWGDPVSKPFFDIFVIVEVLPGKCLRHRWKQVVVRRGQVYEYGGWGKSSQPSAEMLSLTSFAVCDDALSCCKISFPCLVAQSGRFSINAWFKLISCWR